jgi:branched-chain amino acid transport system substrate-binding protein
MNFKMKSLVAVAVLGFSAGSGMAAEPIKIGVAGPFTGGSAPMGVSMRDGVKLAAAEINAKGGVLGRRSSWSNATTKRRTNAACRSPRS